MKKICFIFISVLLLTANAFSLELYKTGVTASYYAEDFHGKKTSNGERFNMNDYTCAHKELPFNTVLKITNLANGKTCEVRVNDRGPFVTSREIDLSKAAAVKLDMIGTGTAKVKIEIVKRGPNTKLSSDTAKSAQRIMAKKTGGSTSTNSNSSSGGETGGKSNVSASGKSGGTAKSVKVVAGKIYDIQVASFSTKENATAFAKKLKKDGFENIVFQSNSEIVRVVLSKVPAENVNAMVKKLQSKGYKDYVVKERKNPI